MITIYRNRPKDPRIWVNDSALWQITFGRVGFGRVSGKFGDFLSKGWNLGFVRVEKVFYKHSR